MFVVLCRDQDMEVRICVVGGWSTNVAQARVHGCTRARAFSTAAGSNGQWQLPMPGMSGMLEQAAHTIR
ncbi:MAG: hypothetical protein MK161_14735 [Pirellulales bacterium]|nr:hypothetical protein [Pirellulales bacterium]